MERYNEAFKDIDWLKTPPRGNDSVDPLFHLYVLQIDFSRIGMERGVVMETLASKGIGTQVHYIPVYRHPFYRDRRRWNFDDFPNAETYYSEALSIPLFPRMSDAETDEVIDAVLSLK